LKKQAEKTLTTLHNLYFSESKPEELQPLDLALTTYLVLRQTDDHFIYDSQDTLAERLGCERKAVARSIDRLVQAGWITTKQPLHFNEKTKRTTRALARTVGLAVDPDRLPQYEDRATRPSVISDNAKHLAAQHTAGLIEMGKSRHPKNFAAMQERAAQRLFDELGDYNTVAAIFNFAAEDPRFVSATQTSLYEVRRRLSAIRKAYAAHQTTLPQMTVA